VDFSPYQYVALSDQDDIWLRRKLKLSIDRIRQNGVAGFSSDVIALWPDGRREVIRKSQEQRPLDHLFESAGQGCTYVITSDCAIRFQNFLVNNRQQVDMVTFHDWMLYAWCRTQGLRWHIEPNPTLLYRQHGSNAHGASSGWRALRQRIQQVRSGWYRREVLKISRLVSNQPFFTPECIEMVQLVEASTWLSRIRLAIRVKNLRRRFKDRALLVFAFLSGAF
jgi:rhamnosyltransferase